MRGVRLFCILFSEKLEGRGPDHFIVSLSPRCLVDHRARVGQEANWFILGHGHYHFDNPLWGIRMDGVVRSHVTFMREEQNVYRRYKVTSSERAPGPMPSGAAGSGTARTAFLTCSSTNSMYLWRT